MHTHHKDTPESTEGKRCCPIKKKDSKEKK